MLIQHIDSKRVFEVSKGTRFPAAYKIITREELDRQKKESAAASAKPAKVGQTATKKSPRKKSTKRKTAKKA